MAVNLSNDFNINETIGSTEFESNSIQLTVLTPILVTGSDEYYGFYNLSTNDIKYTGVHEMLNMVKDDSKDPFRPECRIPLPGMREEYGLMDNKTFVRKRNERERTRVRNVNEGFERLRQHLPIPLDKEKRFSKVETLRVAINYIKHLQSILDESDKKIDEN